MDGFFGIGIGELFFIAVIALIVLGPERLPGALREVGKFIRTIRDMTNELVTQFGDELKVLDDLNPQKLLRELTEDPEEKTKAATSTTTELATSKPTVTPKTAAATSKPAITETLEAKEAVAMKRSNVDDTSAASKT